MATDDEAPSDLLTAREAAALLGVKLQTLYAYASRGRLQAVSVEGRRSLYSRADVLRLKSLSQARSGHGPVAAGALRWGEPVLDSQLTDIDPERGPLYRGRSAAELAEEGVSFELAADLFWTGQRSSGIWQPQRHRPSRSVVSLTRGITRPIELLQVLLPTWMLADAERFSGVPQAEHDRARQVIFRMAASLSSCVDAARLPAALDAKSVAGAIALACRKEPSQRVLSVLDRALVLSLDHELNVSAFAARVTASSGADLYACLAAGLAALSGPRHGGACDRVEALLTQLGSAQRVSREVNARMRRGELIPGFGHPMYPGGDPRARPLLEVARAVRQPSSTLRTLLELVDVMEHSGRPAPSLDVGLVAVSLALGLPSGMATGLFAVGRAAGWVGHVLEQREAANLLRPRARYVGRRFSVGDA